MTLFALWLLALVADVFTIGLLAERQHADNRAYNLREERRLANAPRITVADGGPIGPTRAQAALVATAPTPGRHSWDVATGAQFQLARWNQPTTEWAEVGRG